MSTHYTFIQLNHLLLWQATLVDSKIDAFPEPDNVAALIQAMAQLLYVALDAVLLSAGTTASFLLLGF